MLEVEQQFQRPLKVTPYSYFFDVVLKDMTFYSCFENGWLPYCILIFFDILHHLQALMAHSIQL